VPQETNTRKVKKKTASAKACDLLAWYDRHRRVLPWRALRGEKPDPYAVWLSEVMLQQTTVGAVGPYFDKFMRRWPTVHDLAAADIEDVRRLWAGLGYYRRAHGLHQTALIVSREKGGVFPSSVEDLQELPGLGPYTAAAIAAIAFDRRANVVDGNVERVVARLFGLKMPLPAAKSEIRKKAETLLPESRFGDYAQALMDLGATICTPRNPRCTSCPWAASCVAFKGGFAETLPARLRPKEKPLRRAIAFLLIDPAKGVFLRRRPMGGLLGGMTEVPSSAWKEGKKPKLADVLSESPLPDAPWQFLRRLVRHSFTHFDLEISVAIARISAKRYKIRGGCHEGAWVPFDRIEDEALPSVMRKIVRAGLKKEKDF
jgi:A/G-specific adenine glycosylase